MKTRALRTSLVLLSGILLASCSFNLFNKVTVKASPTLYAPLGSKEFKISDYVSAQTIASSISTGTGNEIYTYVDPAESDVTKMLMRASLGKFSINFGDYLKSINLDSTINASIPTLSIPVPSMNETVGTTKNISFGSDLVTQVNDGFAVTPIPLAETGSSSIIALGDVDFSVTAASFASATFSSGSLNFSFNLSGATPGLELTLTNLAIYAHPGDASPITSLAIPNLDMTQAGATASLPLAGVTLPGSFTLRVSLSTRGGTVGNPITLSVTPSISADTVVSGASGLTLDPQDYVIPPISIPLSSLDSQFVSATIGTGSLSLNVTGMPSGFDRSLDLSITGGINLTRTITNADAFPYDIDLHNQTVSNAPISVSATLHVSATNATVSGMTSSGIDIACQAATNVSSFSALVLHPTTSPNFTQTVSQALDPDMLKWISSIHFNKVGIALNITNSLPSSVAIHGSSTIFAIDSTHTFLNNGVASGPIEYVSSNKDVSLAGSPPVDFTVSGTLTDYDPDTGLLSLSTVSPGTTYAFSGTVSVIADWESATIVANPAISSGTYPETAPLDLSSIGQYLGSNVTFPELPTYIYLSGPSGLKTNVLLDYTYTDSHGAAQTAYLAGSALAGASLTVRDPLPDVLSTTDTYPPEGVTDLPASSLKIDLASLFNARPADLRLHYSFGVDEGFQITKDMLDSGSQTLGADIVIVIPFKFDVGDGGAPITIAGLPVEGSGTDLLGRTVGSSGSDDTNIDLALNNLSSMTLTLNITNKTGLGLDTAFHATLKDNSEFSRTLNLSSDPTPQSMDLTLTADEFKKIKDTNPFSPGLTFTIPKGAYAFSRTGGIAVGVTVKAVTDLNYEITDIGGGK